MPMNAGVWQRGLGWDLPGSLKHVGAAVGRLPGAWRVEREAQAGDLSASPSFDLLLPWRDALLHTWAAAGGQARGLSCMALLAPVSLSTSLSGSALMCHTCGRACCPAGPGPGHAAGLWAHTCLLSLVLPHSSGSTLWFFSPLSASVPSFFLLPPCPACLDPTPGVLGPPGNFSFSLVSGAEEAWLSGRLWAWLAGWSPVGRCRGKRRAEPARAGSGCRPPLPAARLQVSAL